MIVPPLSVAAELIQPMADPVPLVAGKVYPAAKSSANHVEGDVAGNQAHYGDVQAGAWYVARQGRDIRNPSFLRRRALGGLEDCANVKR